MAYSEESEVAAACPGSNGREAAKKGAPKVAARKFANTKARKCGAMEGAPSNHEQKKVDQDMCFLSNALTADKRQRREESGNKGSAKLTGL